MQRRALTRREFVRLTGVLAGLGTLSACVPSAPAPMAEPAAPAATGGITRGGTLVHAYTSGLGTMDPQLTQFINHVFYDAVYNGLVRLELEDSETGKLKVVGSLAESWEQPDAKTIIFNLRQGVKFHDGSDFNAEVAKWNFERQRDHPKSQRKSSLAFIESVDALDNNTLQITSEKDNAALLSTLAFGAAGLVHMGSKAAVDELGEEGITRHGVGTGPFRVKEWITDDRIVLERNPDYWEMGADNQPLPYLDEAVLRVIPDPTVSLVDMRAGSLHLMELVLPKDVETIEADPDLRVDALPWAGLNLFLVGYNTKKPPFDDVRVRMAANYGIDREGMAKALGFGAATGHYYPYYTEGTLGFDPTVERYEYNPDKVKELLTEAGYPDGIDLELLVIAREPEATIGEFAQQMWNAVGINTELKLLERVAWGELLQSTQDFEATFWRGQLWPSVDPEFARPVLGCGATSNWSFFCDQEIEDALNEGLTTSDPVERGEIYSRMWRIVHEKAYVSGGYLIPSFVAYRKEVNGLSYNFQDPYLGNIWLA